RLAASSYANTLAGDIVSDLVKNYLAGEGVIGQHLSRVETSQSDWQTVDTTSAAPYIVFKGTSAGGSRFYYNDVWTGTVAIASGDKLTYDEYLIGPEYASAIDGTFSDASNIRDTGFLDQNGKNAHPHTDLTGLANGQWYSRSFSLTSKAGKNLTSVQIAFEGDTAGNYTSYFRNVYIKDSTN